MFESIFTELQYNGIRLVRMAEKRAANKKPPIVY